MIRSNPNLGSHCASGPRFAWPGWIKAMIAASFVGPNGRQAHPVTPRNLEAARGACARANCLID